ncbi:MAG: hypothetical protein ABFD60_11155 [Bryobacteraceae bacterium]
MSSKKIRKPVKRTAQAIVRSAVVPKSFNWIYFENAVDEVGRKVRREKVFINLDHVSKVFIREDNSIRMEGYHLGVPIDATASANFRAHLEMIGLCIDHAAEIQRGAKSPAPGCACLTPAPEAPPARFCRVCGCTEDEPCVNLEGQGCHWVAEDLCSACSSSSSSPASLDDPKMLDSSCGD